MRIPRSIPLKRTADNMVFDSIIEKDRYLELKLLLRAGEISELKIHPRYEVDMMGKHLCFYSADFSYWDVRNDVGVVEDVKSKATQKDPYYRLRKKAAELYYSMKVTEVVR